MKLGGGLGIAAACTLLDWVLCLPRNDWFSGCGQVSGKIFIDMAVYSSVYSCYERQEWRLFINRETP